MTPHRITLPTHPPTTLPVRHMRATAIRDRDGTNSGSTARYLATSSGDLDAIAAERLCLLLSSLQDGGSTRSCCLQSRLQTVGAELGLVLLLLHTTRQRQPC